MTADFGKGDGLGEEGVVPDIIVLMLNGKKPQRLKAFDQLADERLVHQGTPWPAALVSVPTLLDALSSKKCLGRPLVLQLLGTIAVGVPQFYAQGEHADAVLSKLRNAKDLHGACYRAVAAGGAVYAKLLDHKEVEVRALAAMPLALVSPQECLAALAAKLPKENSEEVASAWLIAFAVASKCAGQKSTVPLVDAAAAKDPRVQASQVIAAMLCGASLGKEMHTSVDATLHGELGAHKTPFGSMQSLCITAALQGGESGIALLVKALKSAKDQSQKDALGTALLRGVLAESRDDGTSVPLRTASSFSPQVRDVVKALPDLTHGPRRHLLKSVGLPAYEKDLEPFLGLKPTRVTERLIAWRGAQVELALIVDAVARDQAPEQEAREAILRALNPAERVAAVQLLAKGAYDFGSLKTWPPQRAVRFWLTLLEDPLSLPVMEALVVGFKPDDYVKLIMWERFIFAVAIHRLRTSKAYNPDLTPVLGYLIAHMWDDFVPLVREVLVGTPEKVRDQLILASDLPAYVSKPGRMGRHTKGAVCQGWFVLDLAVDRKKASCLAVESIAQWKAFPARAESVWNESLKMWAAPANASEHMAPAVQAVKALRELLPESKEAIQALTGKFTPQARAVFDEIQG